jgi:hypothetical protein
VGLLGVAAVALALAYVALGRLFADPRPNVLGARLGMTADELRAHVDAQRPGAWTSSVIGGDWVLDRSLGDVDARFELHEGQLVAVRAEGPRSAGLAESPSFEVTQGSVAVRTVDHDRVRITLLSRACPTHRDEAEALVRSHGAAP